VAVSGIHERRAQRPAVGLTAGAGRCGWQSVVERFTCRGDKFSAEKACPDPFRAGRAQVGFAKMAGLPTAGLMPAFPTLALPLMG
jgi:hypothetical protein